MAACGRRGNIAMGELSLLHGAVAARRVDDDEVVVPLDALGDCDRAACSNWPALRAALAQSAARNVCRILARHAAFAATFRDLLRLAATDWNQHARILGRRPGSWNQLLGLR